MKLQNRRPPLPLLLSPVQAAEAEALRQWVAASQLWEFRAEDGTRLAARSWEVERGQVERGAVLLVHGFGEHTARYPHVARALVRHGFRVVGCDLRGHGQSGGARGQLQRYDAFLGDLDLVASELGVGRGWFVYAHSLGAQIAINWLASTRPALSGAVLLSPWLRLSHHPPLLKMALARVLSRLAPKFTQPTGLGVAHLSRDLPFLLSLPGGPLNHRRMSARMYTECAAGARNARRNGPLITLPLLLAHGSDDALTSPAATAELGTRLRHADQSVELIPGARHELHNDIGRIAFLTQVATWLESQIK